ncbi:MAG TPA: cyclic nucleotide-binding domain-containing protein [Isosphaeraceae bacterium]
MSGAVGDGAAPMVTLTIDGRTVQVPRGTTIYDAAAQLDIAIPILCHREHMNPVAVCRACVVEVRDARDVRARVLAPACYRQVEEGMKVATAATNDDVHRAVATVTELLMADHPSPCAKHREYGDCELELLAERFEVRTPRFKSRLPKETRPIDDSSVVIAVDHNACILCDRCIRGCNDIRHNEVIGRMNKGYAARIAFDLDDPMGDSSCVSCGECMVSCPTGALTNRYSVRSPLPTGTVSADELEHHALFEGVSHAFLRFNEGAVVRRRFQPGQIICREGEFGSTAFYIERGQVDVFIKAPISHVTKKRRGLGLLGLGMRSLLAARSKDRRDEESTTRYIPIDAPVTLDYDNPIASLEAGDIFGEMTCMSSYPRSATVRAATECTVLELGRNVLYILQRNKKSKAMLDERYRRRAVESHLRGVSEFTDLVRDEAEFARLVNFLRPRVDLVRVGNGEVIFRQGDPADRFYLIRIGFVKVAQEHPGGEHVLTYLGPGKSFGEIGLMGHLPEIRAVAPPGVRTATCTALDHVDLVVINGEDFRQLLELFPQVRARFVQRAIEHVQQNAEALKRIESTPLSDFLEQGLMNAQSLLVLDLEKCTRCDECTKACSDAHDGVTRLIRDGLRFDKYLVASSCRSCLDPYCMVGCPVNSIRRIGTREIIIEDWCIGCGKCAENCPYGNINMHGFFTGEKGEDPHQPGRRIPIVQMKATTCDLCRELKDGQPSCVYACPHDAAHRMSGEDLAKSLGLTVTR